MHVHMCGESSWILAVHRDMPSPSPTITITCVQPHTPSLRVCRQGTHSNAKPSHQPNLCNRLVCKGSAHTCSGCSLSTGLGSIKHSVCIFARWILLRAKRPKWPDTHPAAQATDDDSCTRARNLVTPREVSICICMLLIQHASCTLSPVDLIPGVSAKHGRFA